MLIALLFSTAFASDVAVLGAAGRDATTTISWTGADVVVYPSDTGFEFVGRLTPGYAVQRKYQRQGGVPMVMSEAGFVKHLESIEEATVRVGVVGRVAGFPSETAMPFPRSAQPEGKQRPFGLVPGVMAVFDVEWEQGAFGLKGGPGSMAFDTACYELPEGVPPSACMNWAMGFIGGAYTRLVSKKGVTFEAMLGPTSQIGLGYTPGRKPAD